MLEVQFISVDRAVRDYRICQAIKHCKARGESERANQLESMRRSSGEFKKSFRDFSQFVHFLMTSEGIANGKIAVDRNWLRHSEIDPVMLWKKMRACGKIFY